ASSAELSLFRRPLPATNLKFLGTVMWDGRETVIDPGAPDCIGQVPLCFAPVHFELANQANDATAGHAQAAQPLSDAQRTAIVDFETGLLTAQTFDTQAWHLSVRGARGGPAQLGRQPFYFGMNDF